MKGINTEPFYGLPKVEGIALMVVKDAVKSKKQNKEGKDYETYEVDAVFQMEDKGLSLLALHRFDKMGDNGAYLSAMKGKVAMVQLRKNGRGYSDVVVLGLIKDLSAQADALQKAVA